jgi:membrane protein
LRQVTVRKAARALRCGDRLARFSSRRLAVAWQLLGETASEFSRDRGTLMAAALAFYALLSLAPLAIVAVAVAGVLLGSDSARHEVSVLLAQSMGWRAARIVDGWVSQAVESERLGSIVGIVLVAYTASQLFAQLRDAFNQIWNVEPEQPPGLFASVRHYVRHRLLAFALVFTAGPLLLVVFGSRALLTAFYGAMFATSPVAGWVVQGAHVIVSLAVVMGISALLFKVVPSVRIGWRSVWAGALLTSVVFNIGNLLVGFYLGRASMTDAYGAAGSAVVVLLWLYFSAQMFVFGAEFTQVHHRRFGSIGPPGSRQDGRGCS